MGVIIGVFLLAGIVKGVIGLGLPTIAMGLLSTSMEPAAAASLLIIPSLITNIWQLLIGPQFMALIKRLSGFIIGDHAWHIIQFFTFFNLGISLDTTYTGYRAYYLWNLGLNC